MNTLNGLIVIPTHNDAGTLRTFLPLLMREVSRRPDMYSVLVVNGRSTDGTALLAEQHECEVVVHGEEGILESILEGYRRAIKGGYKYLFFLDPRGEAGELFLEPALDAFVAEGAHLVIASRFHSRVAVKIPSRYVYVAAQIFRTTGWVMEDPLSRVWAMRTELASTLLRYKLLPSTLAALQALWENDPPPRVMEVPHPGIGRVSFVLEIGEKS